jgi:hypothetical protein
MDALRNARMSTATYADVVLPYFPVARAVGAHNIRLRFAGVGVSCGVWCVVWSGCDWLCVGIENIGVR